MINKLYVEEGMEGEIKKEKHPLDPHVRLLAFQGGVVAVILIIAIVIRFCFGTTFATIKDAYNQNMNVDTSVSSKATPQGGPLEELSTAQADGTVTDFFTPLIGTVTSKYGIRNDPFTGEKAFLGGVDIAAPEGSQIYAAFGGKVTKSDYSSDYGNYFIIDHGGFSTLYAHCSSVAVKNGQKVEAGEGVARVGSTGRSTGPHLHFELRVKGGKIDPMPFLKGLQDEN